MGFTRKKKMKKIKKSLKRVKYLLRKLKKTLKRNNRLNKRKRTLTLKGGAARPVATAAAVAGPPVVAGFGGAPVAAGPAPGFGAAFVPGGAPAAAAAPAGVAAAAAAAANDDWNLFTQNTVLIRKHPTLPSSPPPNKCLYLYYDSNTTFYVLLFNRTTRTSEVIGEHKIVEKLNAEAQVTVCVADMVKDGTSGRILQEIYADPIVKNGTLDRLMNGIQGKILEQAKTGTVIPHLFNKMKIQNTLSTLLACRDCGFGAKHILGSASAVAPASAQVELLKGVNTHLKYPANIKSVSTIIDPGGKATDDIVSMPFHIDPVDRSKKILPLIIGRSVLLHLGLPGLIGYLGCRHLAAETFEFNWDPQVPKKMSSDLVLIYDPRLLASAPPGVYNRTGPAVSAWVWDSFNHKDLELNEGNNEKNKKSSSGELSSIDLMKMCWIKECGDLFQVISCLTFNSIKALNYRYTFSDALTSPFGIVLTTCDKVVFYQSLTLSVPCVWNGKPLKYMGRIIQASPDPGVHDNQSNYSALAFSPEINEDQVYILMSLNLANTIADVIESNRLIIDSLRVLEVITPPGYNTHSVNVNNRDIVVFVCDYIQSVLDNLKTQLTPEKLISLGGLPGVLSDSIREHIIALKLTSPLKRKAPKNSTKAQKIQRQKGLFTSNGNRVNEMVNISKETNEFLTDFNSLTKPILNYDYINSILGIRKPHSMSYRLSAHSQEELSREELVQRGGFPIPKSSIRPKSVISPTASGSKPKVPNKSGNAKGREQYRPPTRPPAPAPKKLGLYKKKGEKYTSALLVKAVPSSVVEEVTQSLETPKLGEPQSGAQIRKRTTDTRLDTIIPEILPVAYIEEINLDTEIKTHLETNDFGVEEYYKQETLYDMLKNNVDQKIDISLKHLANGYLLGNLPKDDISSTIIEELIGNSLSNSFPIDIPDSKLESVYNLFLQELMSSKATPLFTAPPGRAAPGGSAAP